MPEPALKAGAPVVAARTVPYVNFAAQYAEEKAEIDGIVASVFSCGDFVGGPAVEALEKEIGAYLGATHVIALASGTDALVFGMEALGIGAGDEVITPPNSFVASTAAIVHLDAKPVFADCWDDQNIDPAQIEAKITSRTKAIMPVHLTGRVAAMERIGAIAKKHNLLIIEDAAQSFGSKLGGRQSGTFGDIGCFSAHPLKNLNAAGDAGFVATERADVAAKLKLLRNHGLKDRNSVELWGKVSRVDTLQAEILRMRLRHLPSVIERRRANAKFYQEKITAQQVFMPRCRPEEFNTFHTFVIQAEDRDELKDHLAGKGVQSAIHYPIPIHLQPAAVGLGQGPGSFPVTEHQAGRILTLPVHQFLSRDDVAYVAQTVNDFYRK